MTVPTRESAVRATCVAILVATVGVVATTVAWGVVAPPDRTITSGFAPGDVLPQALHGADRERPTLFVFLRRDCPASQEMARWVPDLTAALSAERDIATVVVLPAEGGLDEQTFASSSGISDDHLTFAAFATLPLAAVPSFVLADRDGVVRWQRAGAVDEPSRATIQHDLAATLR